MPSHFDYIIIGNGLSGLQLALKLASDSYFDDKQFALIDPSEKNTNDKTWSFWETEPSAWNHLVYRSWHQAQVLTSKTQIDLDLKPYAYKTIRAIDFYLEAKAQLQTKENFHIIIDHVISATETKDHVMVTTETQTYFGDHVFDSRIPSEFYTETEKYSSLIQHFKGWVIKTEREVFDMDVVTMMDHRLRDGNQTSFTYVLPFSKTEALIEFTYFTSSIVDESVYDKHIKTYIQDYLKIEDYSISDTEVGQIPMTNFDFSQYNTKNITKIGTGGGWVKGSTGYSFKHTEKKVAKIIDNIKKGNAPSKQLFNWKYKFYDKVFLKVLKDNNHKGEWVFQQFYSKNSVHTMFRFLDEESSLFDELKIMSSLFSWSFIKAFFKTL